jgi:hypothetical protein
VVARLEKDTVQREKAPPLNKRTLAISIYEKDYLKGNKNYTLARYRKRAIYTC